MDSTLHGTDDQLELYAMGRLPESELPGIEDHLLICDGCRSRLDILEREALNIQFAFGVAGEIPDRRRSVRSWAQTFLRNPFFAGGAAVAAAALLLSVFFLGRPPVAPMAAIQLIALRGEMPSVTPAREVDLTLKDAPSEGGPFRVEVVDATGHKEWSGTVDTPVDTPGPSGIEVRLRRKLGEGSYFVRLYDAGGRLLHEYGFVVRR